MPSSMDTWPTASIFLSNTHTIHPYAVFTLNCDKGQKSKIVLLVVVALLPVVIELLVFV